MATETALTKAEASKLATCEKVIEQGLATFADVGLALRTVRDEGLYRGYADFSAYCKQRWNLAPRHAQRQIAAAEVMDDATNWSHDFSSRPTNEAQARELTAVPSKERPAVWRLVLTSAPTDKEGDPVVTAAHIKKKVREWTEAGNEPAKAPEPDPEPEDPPEPPKDRLGNEIKQAEVATAFEGTAELLDLKARVLSVRRAVQAIGEVPLAAHLRRQEIEKDLGNAARALRFAVPYAVCPKCKGRKCDACKNVGWMPKDVYERVPGKRGE